MDIVHKPIGNITCTLVLRHAINILVCCKRNERVPINIKSRRNNKFISANRNVMILFKSNEEKNKCT